MPRSVSEFRHVRPISKSTVIKGSTRKSTDFGVHSILRIEQVDVIWMVCLLGCKQTIQMTSTCSIRSIECTPKSVDFLVLPFMTVDFEMGLTWRNSETDLGMEVSF